MLTKDELNKIAEDMIDGKIFSSNNLKFDDITKVFIGFNLMVSKSPGCLKKKNIAMIYEYLDQSLPRSINGLPSFLSFRYISKDQIKEFDEIYEKCLKLRKLKNMSLGERLKYGMQEAMEYIKKEKSERI